MERQFAYILLLLTTQPVNSNSIWDVRNPALDQNLYEEVLDPELCEIHLNYVAEDTVLQLQFVDAGIRIPKGILDGNTIDFGNYHQCLGINIQLQDSYIQGKYCLIQVPFNQTLNLPGIPGLPNFEKLYTNESRLKYQYANNMILGGRVMGGVLSNESRDLATSPLAGVTLRLSVCIPKVCSTEQAITSLSFNNVSVGFQFTEEFCRLPNDKPWVAADYIAVVLLSFMGGLSLISTIYDVLNIFVYKNELRKSICTIFSVYSNGQKLMKFPSGPNVIHCLDGIRALSMIWVIIGHTFTSEPFILNIIDGFQWLISAEALWLTSAHQAVDTFFLLSGILLVYTTVGKLSGKKLLQNLHFFYLNRILRMFPMLALGVLMEASLYNRIADGPYWASVIERVESCRTYWWTTLLHVQNWVNPNDICVGQSWYLAIDVQLHIISPLVLFWVLSGSKNKAWLALVATLVLHTIAKTIYVFFMDFPSTSANPVRGSEIPYYMSKYYVNTLTRASPFLIGLIVGYILVLCRGRKLRLPKGQVILNWILATIFVSFAIYTSYPILQPTWNNQILDNLYNSFIRPIWAVGVGWLVFACAHGYGGPINWFLSLSFWKLLARLSYAMYILHHGLMFAVNSSAITPIFFSPKGIMFKFLGHFGLILIVSFIAVLFIDLPCSEIIGRLLSGGLKKQTKAKTEELDNEISKGIAKENEKDNGKDV